MSGEALNLFLLEGRAGYSGGLDLPLSPGLLVFLVCPSRMGGAGHVSP